MICRHANLSKILSRVRVLTDFRFVGRADCQVLQDLRGGIDKLMGVLGARRNDDHITCLDREHLASNPQRTGALQDDEHLFLGMMQMIGTGAFSGRYDVQSGSGLPCSCSLRKAAVTARVLGLQHSMAQRHFIDVAPWWVGAQVGVTTQPPNGGYICRYG